ncbi:MAG: hypothetical protein ABI632_01000 [Pseudolysinimonas sp.]
MTTTPIPTGPTGPVAAGTSKLMIALIAVGGVLLLSIVAIIFLLIGQSSGPGGNINADGQTPVPIATDTATPVPEATADPSTDGGNSPAPVDNSVRFTSFNADKKVACDPTGQAEEKAQPQISWSSVNAVKVYWTPNNKDANGDNGYQVGASGNQDDMSASKGPGERYEFPCNHRETFDTTITLVGANGQKVSKHVTFTDINWNSGGSDDEG